MNEVTIYLKENCKLCEEVKALVEILEMDYEILVKEVNILGNNELEQKYLLELPVLLVNGEELEYRQIDIFSIRDRLH
ncbi:glutaredoxin family protein [Halobacillus seohaensis]|uniref:Glutaredoxin family protein n=1 Tax=Halobacillus seohaensis TaxID=447421 RepID=A0ABW2ERR7_9BACI